METFFHEAPKKALCKPKNVHSPVRTTHHSNQQMASGSVKQIYAAINQEEAPGYMVEDVLLASSCKYDMVC